MAGTSSEVAGRMRSSAVTRSIVSIVRPDRGPPLGSKCRCLARSGGANAKEDSLPVPTLCPQNSEIGANHGDNRRCNFRVIPRNLALSSSIQSLRWGFESPILRHCTGCAARCARSVHPAFETPILRHRQVRVAGHPHCVTPGVTPSDQQATLPLLVARSAAVLRRRVVSVQQADSYYCLRVDPDREIDPRAIGLNERVCRIEPRVGPLDIRVRREDLVDGGA